MLKHIKKRNGDIVEFDSDRICQAIDGAINDLDGVPNTGLAQFICGEVIEESKARYSDDKHIPSVEEIQDIVEQKLVELGHFEIAKHYILYRADRAQKRAEERLAELD